MTRPIDVVLVAYRSEDVIEAAVDRAGKLGGTVVVVDHGDGESACLAAAAGAVAIVDPSNPGFGTGQNRGIAFTGSEFVLLCNPDAELRPDAVVAGADLLRSRPDLAAVQGVILNQETGTPERSAGVELGPVHLLGRALGLRRLLRLRSAKALAARVPALRDHAQRVPAAPVDVESLAATAILVRRSAFDAVEGFDESYFLYGEDQDLCHRLRSAGWRLVAVPEVWATHVSGGSAESGWDRELRWWEGTMRFAACSWTRTPWLAALVAASIRGGSLAVRRPSGAGATLSALIIDPARARRGAGLVTR